MSSGIGTIVAETRGEGVITNTLSSSLPISFVRTDKHAQGSDLTYPANYSGINYLPATIDKTINRIVFDEKQFYLPDGGDTKFIGWYPQATSTTASETTKVRWNAANGTVTFPAIDGSTDILVAQPVVGSKNNRFNDDTHKVRFSHALTQVKVFVKAKHSAYIPYWGQITAIEFVGKCQPCVFTFPGPRGTAPSDTVSTSFPTTGATDLKMRTKGGTGPHETPITLNTDETEVGYAMFAPHKIEDEATAKLRIKVTTTVGGIHYIDLTFEQANLLAGQYYNLTLAFDAVEIEPTAVIDKWEKGKEQPDEITVV